MTERPTPDAPTDATLAAAYQAGDERAATELVRRHAVVLGRFLYSSGAPAGDVEDLVQEAFFRGFRSLERWRAEGSMRSWLFTIGANLLRDDFRKRKGRQMLPLEDRDLADRADPHADLVAAEAGRSSGFGRDWQVCPDCSGKSSCAGRSWEVTTRRSPPPLGRRRAQPGYTITTPYVA